MTFFFSRTVKKVFSWTWGPWWFMKCESAATITLRVKKTYTGNTKLIPMTPDDIMWSYEAKRSVCAKNWTLFATLLPVIHSLKHTGWSDVRFLNKTFFWTGSFGELVEQVQQIRLKCLKQIMARAAQIYKLLYQNSLSDAWQSLRLKMSQNTGVWSYDEWTDSAPVPPTVTELKKQFDSDRRTDAWTELLNEGAKWRFFWFLNVYVKRWADED